MSVSLEDVKIEELRLRYLELLDRPDVYPTRANWEFISSKAMHGLGHLLYHKYLTALTIDDNDREELHDIAIEEFPKFLKSINREEALEVVYSDLSTAPAATLELIKECELFDANYLLNLLDNSELRIVMELIDVYQPSYSDSDVEAMTELRERLEDLPELGFNQEVGGLFGSSLKYICPAGHKNSPDAEFCTHPGCGLNRKGLTKTDINKIDLYDRRVQAVANLIHRNSLENIL